MSISMIKANLTECTSMSTSMYMPMSMEQKIKDKSLSMRTNTLISMRINKKSIFLVLVCF